MFINIEIGKVKEHHFDNSDGRGAIRAMGFIMGLRQMTSRAISVDYLGVTFDHPERVDLKWKALAHTADSYSRTLGKEDA